MNSTDSVLDDSMDSKFVDLVKKHSESEKRKETLSPKLIEARINWWITRVADLFTQVKGWLGPLIEDRTVTFETPSTQIAEHLLGPYTVKRAVIKLANETLEMNPVGTVIFGSFGRIDLKGPNGQVMLILEASQGTEESDFVPVDGRWFIVKREESRRSRSELNEETFEQLFADLFGINAL